MVDVSNGFDVRGRSLQAGELPAWLAEHSLGNRFGLAFVEDGAVEGKASGLAIVAADGDGRYIDTATLTADDEAALASWLADPGPPKAVHEGKRALHALGGCGWTLRGVTSDVALAAYLLQPDHPGRTLNDHLRRYLRRELPPGSDPILTACAVLDLADVLDEELARVNASALLGRVELPVQRVLAGMETAGIAVDRALLVGGELKNVRNLDDSIRADGRTHATFHQTTPTGTITSSEPDLQLVTDLGLRHAFVAGEGYAGLMTARYGELELRVMAHLCGDPGLSGALADVSADADPFGTMASHVFSIPIDQVTPQLRRGVRAMSSAVAEGLSAAELAPLLELTPFEASEQMDWYLERFVVLREHLRGIADDARELGYVSTLLGRRRYLADADADDRVAVAAVVQGGAADIRKVALGGIDVALRGAGLRSRPLLQVGDEFVLEVAPGEHEALAGYLVDYLSEAHPLDVPLQVSVGFGSAWGSTGRPR